MNSTAPASPSPAQLSPVQPPPADVGGYAVLDTLQRDVQRDTSSSESDDGTAQPQASYLALAPGGRKVVLKMLDHDCLLRNHLHPSIRDRLGRVRELAHGGVANLHGVERDAGRVFLIWDYVDGQTFTQWAAAPTTSYRDVLTMARELALAIESLHSRGIVHGAIHGGNVLIDRDKRLRLTHVSPLLYNDPAEDLNAALELLRQSVERRGDEAMPLGRLLDEFTAEVDARVNERPAAADAPAEAGPSLRSLASRLTGLIEQREAALARPAAAPRDTRDDRQRRSRTWLGAAGVAVLACGLYYGARQYLGHPPARTFAPAEASPAAL